MLISFLFVIKITIQGDGREPNTLLSAPSAVLANVFASLARSQFTVKGFKMSTILST